MWSGVARILSERFRVLKPDLAGRGENPAPPPLTIDGHADFLEAIVRDLPSPVGLAGFSMGGYAVFALMKRRPERVRAVAFVDTRAVADDEETARGRRASIEALQTQGVGPIAEAMLPRQLSADSLRRGDLTERVRRIMFRQKPETLAADLEAMRSRPDSTAFLGEITVPSLVIAGEHDSIATPQESALMARAIPGGRFVQIPAAAHLTPMEQPKAVATALGDFFGENLGGATSENT